MTNNTLQSKFSEVAFETSKDFKFFRKYYFKHYHKFPDAQFHREVCDLLVCMTDERGSKLALAAPRGSAKSTIITLQYVLYCICHKKETFIVIISGTASQAEGFLSEIKAELQNNKLLLW